MIINAGLDEVVIRRTETEFDIVPVQTWIDEDELAITSKKAAKPLF